MSKVTQPTTLREVYGSNLGQDIVFTEVCAVFLSRYRHYLTLGHVSSIALPFQLVIFYHLLILC
jgi:predicted metal-dependent HD superfamily phosphohydrolase